MAGKTDSEWTEATNNGTPANAEGWGQTIDAESQVVLSGEGDGFIATYLEMDETSTGIKQLHLEDVYDLNDQYAGKYLFMNATRDLERKFKSIPAKAQVRVQWVSSQDTGQKDPMRIFNVQWR